MAVCRSARKDGDSGTPVNWPGSTSCEPEVAATRACRASYRLWWNRSTRLLDCGWYAVVVELSMLSSWQRAAHKEEVN